MSGLYGTVTVAGWASDATSGSIEKPCIQKWDVPPSVGGGISPEMVSVVSDARAPAGMLSESPLIGELASFTVMTPPLAAGIVAVTSTLVPNTDKVKLWLAWPDESVATTVTDTSPA